ncbi:fungal-specific transcription factor domain-containing protein [Tricladium varicosporioides]|nr:fungal-specific transcription factor domain-containing protein [Hymenoscyphus varicosporioides]
MSNASSSSSSTPVPRSSRGLLTPRKQNADSGFGGELRRGSASGSGEWICQFVGLSGDQDPYVLRHCSFNALNCYKAPDWAILRVKGGDDIPLHFTVTPDSHLETQPSWYPRTDTEAVVRLHSEELLKTYFEVVHTSYPLLDPGRFVDPPRTGDVLRAVMYNLAAPFCPTSPSNFKLLEDFVNQALPTTSQAPLLESLEAALLHLHHTSSQPTTNATALHTSLHSTLGSLVGLANSLGLNLSPATWSLTPSDRSRRIRIWWSLYTQDAFLSLLLGRPSYLNPENHSVPLPTLEDFSHLGLQGEEIGFGPARMLISMSHLSVIISSLLSTFYTLAATSRLKTLPILTLLSQMSAFQDRLNTFYTSHLRPLCTAFDASLLDPSGSVILAFYTAEIVLYRAVLRVLPMEEERYAEVRERARSVMVNVVSFTEKLHVSRLRSFWWNRTSPLLLSILFFSPPSARPPPSLAPDPLTLPQIAMSPLLFSLHGTFLYHQLLTSVAPHDISWWSTTISHFRALLKLQAQSGFQGAALACERMERLAVGMGLEAGGENGEGVGGNETRGGGWMEGSAEEWIVRQGHEGMLLC